MGGTPKRETVVGFLMVIAVALGAPGVMAQQGQPGGAEGQAGEAAADTELVFEREVFRYPAFERRNPFRPLLADEAGPRFESMRLQGIIYTPGDRARSLVILAAGGGQDGGTTRRLREGERWGNVRVVEIRTREVLVEIDEFGQTEQMVMRLPTPGRGGS